jgi:hypothetical protein
VGYNRTGLRCHRDFDYKVIPFVQQIGAPQKAHGYFFHHPDQRRENALDLRWRIAQASSMLGPCQHIPILGQKFEMHHQRQLTCQRLLHHKMARTTSRLEG